MVALWGWNICGLATWDYYTMLQVFFIHIHSLGQTIKFNMEKETSEYDSSCGSAQITQSTENQPRVAATSTTVLTIHCMWKGDSFTAYVLEPPSYGKRNRVWQKKWTASTEICSLAIIRYALQLNWQHFHGNESSKKSGNVTHIGVYTTWKACLWGVEMHCMFM